MIAFIEKQLQSVSQGNQHQIKRYINFISSCQQTVLIGPKPQKHHILPKALFPDFADFKTHAWNAITLPFHHHRVAHRILAKAFPISNMRCALSFFNISLSVAGTKWYNDGERNYRLIPIDAKGLNDGRLDTSVWCGKTYVSKDGINKQVKISELSEYLESGWEKRLIKDNDWTMVTDDTVNFGVSNTDLEYFLFSNPEFRTGVTVRSEKRQRGKSKRYHHPKTQQECNVLNYEVEDFLKAGWAPGRSTRSKDSCANAANQINKDGKGKRVSDDDLEQYLKDGWVLGLPPQHADHSRKANSGTIRIHKQDLEKSIQPTDLDKFLSDGWKKGRAKKNAAKIGNKAKGKIKIFKEDKEKNINPDELPTYQADGWERGRGTSYKSKMKALRVNSEPAN